MNEKENIFSPAPCAEEIVAVLEKHGVSVLNLEKVLAVAKDMACASTKIQLKKSSV